MSWKSYNLDREAQKLVLIYRDKPGVIGQSHKMRSTVAYGLERFWGEQLRLLGKNDDEKGKYWQATWKAFVRVMKTAGIQLPQEEVDAANTRAVQDYAMEMQNISHHCFIRLKFTLLKITKGSTLITLAEKFILGIS